MGVLLTIPEVAEILKISTKTVWKYIVKDKILNATKHGRDYFIDSDQLIDFKRPRRGNPRLL